MNSIILFVDDEKQVLDGIKRRLSKTPYTLLFAQSGQEALEILKKQHIDIIVADLVMPGMSGLQLLEKTADLYPQTVRIILSGFTEVPSILKALNSNLIFRFLTKPWRIDDDGLIVLEDAARQSALNKAAADTAFHIPLDMLLNIFDEHKVSYIIGNSAGVVEYSSSGNYKGKTFYYAEDTETIIISDEKGSETSVAVSGIITGLSGLTSYVTS